jgi:hypothetical protein
VPLGAMDKVYRRRARLSIHTIARKGREGGM